MKFISIERWLIESAPKQGKAREIDKKIEEPTFGCVMMDSKIDDWKEYHTGGIDKKDLYEKDNDDSYGVEEEPHVTILFGIHEDDVDPEIIKQVMEENMKPITVRVEDVGIFEGDEYDVVKYNIPVTEELQEYRDLFLKFPNTQTFPDFKPHMTLAYVKPGKGKKYKRKLKEPFDVTFTNDVYSWHDNPENPEDLSKKKVNLEKDESKDR